MLNEYRFRHRWRVEADPQDVFRALHALDRYPQWWPEVRAVRRLDDKRAEVVARSLLPYELRFVTEQTVVDSDGGVLAVVMEGDLDGTSRWTIGRAARGGSVAVFEEHVLTTKRSMNRLAPIARPLFIANHARMMRNGEAGLRTFLAGVRFAREG